MMQQITSAQAVILAINSFALGGLLFLLSAGFSLIFGLMRIPNLMHGSFFMLGAYFGVLARSTGACNFWLAALLSGLAMAVIGGVIERFLLRRLEGQVLPQVLLTLGFAFIIADLCLMIWTGDPWQPTPPPELRGAVQAMGMFFPLYRLVVLAVAVAVAIALWIMVDWTRLGAMIRAGVDDPAIARVCRHQGVAAVHHRVLPRRGACRLRRRDGRAVSCRSIPGSISRCCRSP